MQRKVCTSEIALYPQYRATKERGVALPTVENGLQRGSATEVEQQHAGISQNGWERSSYLQWSLGKGKQGAVSGLNEASCP